MAKFDPDDPLGDLLSDGSDDSFFDDPKVQAKRASITKSPDKKTVSDLFGLDDTKNKPKPVNDDWLGLESTKAKTPSPMRRKPVKKISFEEDTLDFEPKSKPDAAKKSSLMESILGPSKPSKEEDKMFLSLDDLLKESKAMKKPEIPIEVTQSASQLHQVETKPTFGMSSLEAPREGRRGRPRTAVADPLGLFNLNANTVEKDKEPATEVIFPPTPTKQVSNVPKAQEKLTTTTKSKSDGNIAVSEVPDWLGGQIKTDIDNAKTESQATIPLHAQTSSMSDIDNLVTQQKLATSHFEYQNTSIALQQQESQLLMALQLKKYEENMSGMQRKQSDVLVKQEQQFNHLLERQFAKQQVMENNMRLQQERINSHIQMLLHQLPVSSAVSTEELEKIGELKRTDADEVTRQYDAIIAHLKQRQHEEVFLLEESYKKQISTLEQSTESVENHLKMELDSLVQKQREKLETLDEEHRKDIDKYRKKIEELHQAHEVEIRQMRENNNRTLEEIKYEYNTIIENLKMSKSVEQDANSYTQRLDASLHLLDANSRSLIDIREKVHSEFGVLSKAREESIKAKQQEIDLMKVALEKARESADDERAQLMALVRGLELKLAEHSHNAREERFALQQAAAILTARTTALDREVEFNRQSLEREREQLNILRETILAEQEKSLQEIANQKLKMHSEKTRLETASKLNQNYDTARAKAEVDAAIQVAREAAAMTDAERANLMQQVREVEALKRTLVDRESRLNNRERDLEVAMEHANRKNLLGEKALDDARVLQINYNDKLREIQAQMSSINMSEKRLAEDKIAISKERLALHNNQRQIRKCGLCNVENQINDHENDYVDEALPTVEQDLPRFISVSDADMFRMQLQMSEEQLTPIPSAFRL